jgi:uncharacterized protein (DUF2141 family)
MQKLKIIPITYILLFVLTGFGLNENAGKSYIPREQADLSDSSKFSIEIEGLRNDIGKVRIAIYDKEETFLKDGGPLKVYITDINNGKASFETCSLPNGEYAIGIMHDENENEKLDLTLIKLPKEGFGFSNNPTIRVMKPSFKETKVELNASNQEVKIKAKYFF